MRKNSYPLENETLNIVTPPNETYEGKEIPTVITTTEGVYVQSGKSLKIFKAKEQAQTKKFLNLAQIMKILKTMMYKIIQKN